MNTASQTFAARQAIVGEYQTLVDRINGRGGNATAAEQAEIRSLEYKIEAATADHQMALDNIERRDNFQDAIEAAGFDHRSHNRNPVADREMDAFLRRYALGEERSVDIGAAIESRNAAALFAGAGANSASQTVPVSVFPEVIASEVEVSGLFPELRKLFTSGGEPMKLPRKTAGAKFTRYGEGATIAASNIEIGGPTLSSHKYSFLAQASNELLADARVNIVSEVGRDAGQALDALLDHIVITGQDEDGQAVTSGILSGATGHVTASASALDGDDFISVFHSMPRSHRNRAGWLISPEVLEAVRKLKDNEGRYLVSTLENGVSTLLGRPIWESGVMPDLGTNDAPVVALCDPSGTYLRLVGGLDVARSDSFAFSQDLATWRFRVRLDSALVVPESVRILRTVAA